ncbi:MAG: DegT/DnrJ/EryC1/StrS family aminotransferase [Rhizomicrobium sp.]
MGCYGDGGRGLHRRRRLEGLLLSLRMHGQGADRYENVRIGMNSRLDTIQAAILIEKLGIFADEIEKRDAIAARYNNKLGVSNRIRVPHVIDGALSTWAQYTIQVPNRDELLAKLKAEGIPTAVYYPIPLSRQKGYAAYPSAPTPVSERIAKTVVSLPMHPYLDAATQDRVIAAVLTGVA